MMQHLCLARKEILLWRRNWPVSPAVPEASLDRDAFQSPTTVSMRVHREGIASSQPCRTVWIRRLAHLERLPPASFRASYASPTAEGRRGHHAGGRMWTVLKLSLHQPGARGCLKVRAAERSAVIDASWQPTAHPGPEPPTRVMLAAGRCDSGGGRLRVTARRPQPAKVVTILSIRPGALLSAR